MASFVNEIAHLKLIYEGLTRLDSELKTVPGAAESWEYNADATQLTFKLRDGLTYSDGSILNAKRFEYSILRNINPATAGEYAGITDEIVGAPEWRSADLTTATEADLQTLKDAVGVKALDAAGNACADYEQVDCTTLQITMSKPAPYFHTVMSLWVTYPAKEELITEGGETWWNDAAYHIGNGPMVLSELDPSNRGYFTPNTNYWRGQANINLEFKYITDTAVSFEAYKNGEFDIIGLGAEDLATVKADAELNAQAMIYPGSCTYNLNFHRGKPPFDDPAVREAFAYSFDRESWVKDVLKDLGSPTQTWIPKGFPGYDPDETRFAYDPAKTLELLTAAGYAIEGGKLTKGGTPIDITLTFSDTPRNRTRNEWIAGKWKEALGLEVGLNPVEPTTYTALSKDVATAPQFFIMGWCADYPDPQNWLSVYWMSTSSFAQRIKYVNADLDAKMQEADKTLDPAARMALYAEAQKMVIGSIPGITIWNNVNAYLVKPNVKGITTTPQDSGWPGDIDPLTIIVE
jgi:oligopeptide transport system substrate-binding protein